MSAKELEVDVLIVGSGPAGATYARKLVEAGRSVYMIDMGAMHSQRPGSHLKNAFYFQRNLDAFSSIIRGHLHGVSVPTNNQPELTLDPRAFPVRSQQVRRLRPEQPEP
jgi:choline dehydrogenase-like flavoprotein